MVSIINTRVDFVASFFSHRTERLKYVTIHQSHASSQCDRVVCSRYIYQCLCGRGPDSSQSKMCKRCVEKSLISKGILPGETDLIWCFNDPKILEKFVTTSDSDHNEGYSRCQLDMSPAGRARFHGHLDVQVPKDGRIKKAGYCAFRSKRVRVSNVVLMCN